MSALTNLVITLRMQGVTSGGSLLAPAAAADRE